MPGRLITAACLLAAATLSPPAAGAAVMRLDAAITFADRLGNARTGGIYVDMTGRTVITVTDRAAAKSVTDAGGVAKIVGHSLTELRSVSTALDGSARMPGTSWGIDPSTNQVSVELDSTVTGPKLSRLRAATSTFGDAVRVDRIPGRLALADGFTSGGQGIQDKAQKFKCSIGFNVRNSAGAKFFVTAGHCGKDVNTWYKAADGTYLGTDKQSSFPGDDYAVVTYRNSDVSGYGTVWVGGAEQQITGSRNPVIGEQVSRVGSTSSDLVGAVLLTGVTVNYDEGTVTGLIKTSNCVQFGDSGGPLFDGTIALGIASGGTDPDQPCTSGVSDRRSYYQPVQPVLDHTGLTVF